MTFLTFFLLSPQLFGCICHGLIAAVCCSPPFFAAGFPLLHTSFGFDSAGKLGRFTQLSGVQDRMRPVSSEVCLRVGMGGVTYGSVVP